MEYLKRDDIIFINEVSIERYGGKYVPPENLLNENALNYLVEAFQSELFGQQIYPEIHEKAGLYLYKIVSNHIFQDGNKRTGLESSLLFLKLNGYRLKNQLNQINMVVKQVPQKGQSVEDLLYQFVMETASGKLILKEVQLWFKHNIEMI